MYKYDVYKYDMYKYDIYKYDNCHNTVFILQSKTWLWHFKWRNLGYPFDTAVKTLVKTPATLTRVPGFAVDSSFLLLSNLRVSRCWLSNLVLGTHMGNLD